MAIVKRNGLGRPLTYAEVDGNFDAINAVAAAAQAAAQSGADAAAALSLADYVALRAYAGSQSRVYVTGYLVSAAPSGIAGMFVRDDSDTTSADNGGTVIVAGNGKRWKRAYVGPANAMWFGSSATSLQQAFAATQSVTVPKSNTVTLNTALQIPDGGNLIVYGAITGTGSIVFLGSGKLTGFGIINGPYVNITNGDVLVQGMKFSGQSATAAILVDGAATITRLRVLDNVFEQVNYGILRQGQNSTLNRAVIARNTFYNNMADAVEWNVCPNDSDVWVMDNDIDLINNTTANGNWGIGIGFAGKNYDTAYADANMVKDFHIWRNKISRCAQGIHVECGKRFTIKGHTLRKIDNTYSTSSGLNNSGIAVFGCSDFRISDNEVTDSTGRAIITWAGVVNSSYVAGNRDYEVVRNTVERSGDFYMTFCGTGGKVRVADNSVKGVMRLYGKASDMVFERNHVVSGTGTALYIDLDPAAFDGSVDKASGSIRLEARDNEVRADDYSAAVSIANFTPDVLRAFGNNFALASAKTNLRTPQRIFTVNTANNFPYGVELLKDDLVIDADTPTRWLVTTAGSRNRGSDTFSVVDAYNIKSTNYAWTGLGSGGNHEVGQKITLPGCGAGGTDLKTTIVQVYISGGNYQIKVQDAISASVGTAGTLAATNPVAFIAV
jgi:hypothetical protein